MLLSHLNETGKAPALALASNTYLPHHTGRMNRWK